MRGNYQKLILLFNGYLLLYWQATTASMPSAPPVTSASPSVYPSSLLTPMNCFWVMPPPEHRPHEYPRPMSIVYNVVQDAFVPKEALIHMRECVKYYYIKTDEGINLHDTFTNGLTYWDKLKMAIKARVPKDHFLPLIEYLHKILRIKYPLQELLDPPSPPPTVASTDESKQRELADAASNSSIATLNSFILKNSSRDAEATNLRTSARALLAGSTGLMESNRSRPYPDPSKMHPLLVDRSEERALQPLVLDRNAKVGIPSHSLPAGEQNTPEEKAHIQQLLSEQQQPVELSSKSSVSRESTSPNSIPLPATQNPPDYPFPLLRGMMAEQVSSSVQKQQEHRLDEETAKDKLLYHSSQSSKTIDSSHKLMEKELLIQFNEKFLRQQQSQDQLSRQHSVSGGGGDSAAKLHQSLSSALAGNRSQTSPPAYGASVASLHQPFATQLPPPPPPPSSAKESMDRGSPPPYPSITPRHAKELSIFPSAQLSSKGGATESLSAKKSGSDETNSLNPHTFPPISSLVSGSSSNIDTSSLLPHNLTITPTSAHSSGNISGTSAEKLASNNSSSSSSGGAGLSSTLSITAVTKSNNPSSSGGNSSTSTTQAANILTSSALSLASQHAAAGLSLFYSGHHSSPSPLSSSPLSAGPFNPPRTNSPSLSSGAASVEVSPRHTEWAQNALQVSLVAYLLFFCQIGIRRRAV